MFASDQRARRRVRRPPEREEQRQERNCVTTQEASKAIHHGDSSFLVGGVSPDGVRPFSPAHRTAPGVAFFRSYDESVSQLSPRPELEPDFRDYEPIHPEPGWKIFLRKLWAPIVGLGAFLAKFGVVLLKFKFLFSMFVSAAIYVWIGGWWFGIGLIVLLFVHEMGHVSRRAPGAAGLGAAVHPVHGRDDHHEADAAGRLARGARRDRRAAARLRRRRRALARSASHSTRSTLKALAFLGFLINLFNLLPVVPARRRPDHRGDPPRAVAGRRARAARRSTIYRPNPMLIIILLVAANELWQRWKIRGAPADRRATTGSSRTGG